MALRVNLPDALLGVTTSVTPINNNMNFDLSANSVYVLVSPTALPPGFDVATGFYYDLDLPETAVQGSVILIKNISVDPTMGSNAILRGRINGSTNVRIEGTENVPIELTNNQPVRLVYINATIGWIIT